MNCTIQPLLYGITDSMDIGVLGLQEVVLDMAACRVEVLGAAN